MGHGEAPPRHLNPRNGAQFTNLSLQDVKLQLQFTAWAGSGMGSNMSVREVATLGC